MSRIFQKVFSLLAIAAIGFVAVFAAAPQADAQYAPDEVNSPFIAFTVIDPIPCGGQFYGTISGGTGPYTLSYTMSSGGNTISLGSFVVTYQGDYTAPAGFVDYAVVANGTYLVTYVVTDATGQTYTNSFTTVVTDSCPGKGASSSTPIAVPATQPIAAPHSDLAFTGNDVSLPITAGAILIGSGGLLLLAANKRNRKI